MKRRGTSVRTGFTARFSRTNTVVIDKVRAPAQYSVCVSPGFFITELFSERANAPSMGRKVRLRDVE